MRIVIDLQACQTESRNRGIGRYSLALAKAMARQQSGHELRFTLNDLFADQVAEVQAQFTGLVAPDRFSYYRYPDFEKSLTFSQNYQRPVAGTLVRHHYAHLRTDVLHISSPFEGWGTTATVPAGLPDLPGVLCSVTLYDLIPLLMPDWYLPAEEVKNYYHQKLRLLRECDLLLAISEAARQDAIEHLAILPEKIVNISGAAEAHFRPLAISPAEAQEFRQRYGLREKFILYTGALDYRKNMAGAIAGYARLPLEVRRHCQLVIVCAMNTLYEKTLLQYAAGEGLAAGEVVFTGFVPEEDLLCFYNLCTLFIFPSLYEGFGLPILEAMACGAPVLGADNSSIPELIGRRDALFDAKKPEAIAGALYRGLTDEGYRADLQAWGPKRAQAFNWEASAARALAAFEEARARNQPPHIMVEARSLPRRKMAYFSPALGQDGEFVAYTTQLLPQLARYYELDLFTDVPAAINDAYVTGNFKIFAYQDFAARSNHYETVMYHLGSRPCYAFIYDLLLRYPGIVVLHDFFIGKLLCHIAATEADKSDLWEAELEYAHGLGAVWAAEQPEGVVQALRDYPCNRRVLDTATGVIVHSPAARELAQRFYPRGMAAAVEYIDLAQHPSRIAAQYALAIEKNTQRYFAQQQTVLVAELAEILTPDNYPEPDFVSIAECAVANRPNFRPPRLLIDTSHIMQADYQDGIQRVVKNITEQLCKNSTGDWQAVPVCLTSGKLYVHKAVMSGLHGAEKREVWPAWHDSLLMLDVPWVNYDAFRSHVFPQMRRKGGSIYMVVYDLLCVLQPHFFGEHGTRVFSDWLAAGMQDSDGLICISRTVADELVSYMQTQKLPYRKNLKIGYFHLGADMSRLSWAQSAAKLQDIIMKNDWYKIMP